MTNQNDLDGTSVPFAPAFVHRLHFTLDVFGADRGILSRVLEPSGDRPAKVQFWLDEHVAAARPDLKGKLKAFARAHPDRIELAGNVQVVVGGEAVKNDIHVLERMLKVFHAANLDRRSYVVVIGGGAVLDAVGFAAAIAHRGFAWSGSRPPPSARPTRASGSRTGSTCSARRTGWARSPSPGRSSTTRACSIPCPIATSSADSPRR